LFQPCLYPNSCGNEIPTQIQIFLIYSQIKEGFRPV
jgi:hypothetical protein